MSSDYTVPEQTKIGHIHLKVSDLHRSIEFYREILGFQLTMKMGNQAAFLSAGGYHHHIGLNTWRSKNGKPAPSHSTGLFHAAILLPSRKALAEMYMRLTEKNYPLTGTADHGVSEAIYLNDPDENGLEFYRDRAQSEWPRDEDGNIEMYTKPLNINDLLNEVKDNKG